MTPETPHPIPAPSPDTPDADAALVEKMDRRLTETFDQFVDVYIGASEESDQWLLKNRLSRLKDDVLRRVLDVSRAAIKAVREGSGRVVEDLDRPAPHALTNAAFVGYAARIAGKSANWAADTAQMFFLDEANSPIKAECAMRFLAEIRSVLDYIEQQVRTIDDPNHV